MIEVLLAPAEAIVEAENVLKTGYFFALVDTEENAGCHYKDNYHHQP
jgi:hypothetical protein